MPNDEVKTDVAVRPYAPDRTDLSRFAAQERTSNTSLPRRCRP
jgi:hypothetical protein